MVLKGAWKIDSVQLEGCALAPPTSVVCSRPSQSLLRQGKTKRQNSYHPSTVHHYIIDVRQRSIRIPK